MSNSEFIYTTYIKTSAEKLWQAITNPEFSRQYWVDGITSDWKEGSNWMQIAKDGGTPPVGGKILESNPPKRLVMTWEDGFDATDTSRVTFDIETLSNDMVQLNVWHGDFKTGSQMIGKVTFGWSRVLSSLKSLLETGKALDTWAGASHTCGSTTTLKAA